MESSLRSLCNAVSTGEAPEGSSVENLMNEVTNSITGIFVQEALSVDIQNCQNNDNAKSMVIDNAISKIIEEIRKVNPSLSLEEEQEARSELKGIFENGIVEDNENDVVENNQ